MAILRYTLGDRLPALARILNDANGVIDLTGATVTFSMRDRASDSVKVNKSSVTVVNATAGSVSYAWASGDLDTEGHYDAEFEITSSGLVLTVPNAGHDILVVQAAVN